MDAPRNTGHPRTNAASRTRQTLSLETHFSRFVLVAVIATAIAGWLHRDRLPSPEEGLGYTLGIGGSVMMLVLLIYPLRKRLHAARWLGSVGVWFRLHMLLGLLGPLAILYHARFEYSATNSGIALWAMLIVVASGLTGRFIYVHVHRGYSQGRLEARELLDELTELRSLLDADSETGHHAVERLARLEQLALAKRQTLAADATAMLVIGIRSRILYRQLRRMIHDELAANDVIGRLPAPELSSLRRAIAGHVARYLAAMRALCSFAFYTRLFRAWHYLHLPLFLFLLVTAILHILAVHMY
jgi:hypothetical protein